MPNTIKTISLTDDDKSYLNKLLTQSTLEIRVYQRARILLLKSEGASNEAIADKLDIEELLKAIEGSSKSYEEILDFIQGKEKRGE